MRGTASAIACALVLAGCGDSDPQLAPIERQELHAFVERARSAAATRDLAATNAALEALQARVRALRDAGRIDGEMAERLLKYSAIAQLRARTTLRSEPPPAPTAEAAPPAASEAEPAPPAAPAADADTGDGNDTGNDKDKDKNKNNEKGNDKGNGNGKADD